MIEIYLQFQQFQSLNNTIFVDFHVKISLKVDTIYNGGIFEEFLLFGWKL